MSKTFKPTTLVLLGALALSGSVNASVSSVAETGVAVVQQSTKKVSGVVLDNTGMGIIGANVVVKGTTNGTVTDFDGNFTLTVPTNATLVVSYIGYEHQEFSVAGKSTFNITLQEDSEMLDEVVVVGFGTQ